MMSPPANHAPLFLGIDLGGAGNTWVVALKEHSHGLTLAHTPALSTLEDIASLCDRHEVLSVALDAHMAVSLSDEKGFRTGDHLLRSMLPAKGKAWVGSFNSMMGIPIRGMMLGQALAPLVGTILETHPRANLWFALSQDHEDEMFGYKRRGSESRKDYLQRGPAMTRTLWEAWCTLFSITHEEEDPKEGALDALACATIAWLYHKRPEALMRLTRGATGSTGYGPFYVLAPR